MQRSLAKGSGAGPALVRKEALAAHYNPRSKQCQSQRLVPDLLICTAAAIAEQAPTDDSAKQKQLSWRIGAKVLPHPEKLKYGGEDAFFTSSVGGGAMGVADGVGGWAYAGVNPAEYARTFMHLACAYLEGKSVHPVSPQDLKEALAQSPLTADASMDDEGPLDVASTSDSMETLSTRGALAAAHAGTRLPGSATACVMRLNRDTGALSAANVGDSGFLLARKGRRIFRSEPLQHFFDCPFQFAASPEFSENTDHVESALVVELEMLPGDVIVAGTDGVWDNLPEQELLALLPSSADGVSQAAEQIAQAAQAHAEDDNFESPYSRAALRQGLDLPWWQKLVTATFKNGRFELGRLKGGKVDDITVLVAVVEETAIPPASSFPGPGASSEMFSDRKTDSSTSSTLPGANLSNGSAIDSGSTAAQSQHAIQMSGQSSYEANCVPMSFSRDLQGR